VFAWKPADMPGVPRELIEHSLDVLKTAKPIKQKLRWFARDKNEAIRVEVNRLLAASFYQRGVSPRVACQPGSYKKKE
jgi:hypothetical protein